MITATVTIPIIDSRIKQCDIFKDIKVVESVTTISDKLNVNYLSFPLVIVLNQDCDLNSDNRNKEEALNKNTSILHIVVAPVFIFDKFLEGTHWNGLFDNDKKQKKTDTAVRKIMNNEDPRYHYLHFLPSSGLPDLIIDFKHFFTISRTYLYERKNKRVCSIDELFREKITQRFAFYISRIGLPEFDENTGSRL